MVDPRIVSMAIETMQSDNTMFDQSYISPRECWDYI